jgi:hypothetical protein
MANRAGHRRFGNVRLRESGRYQIRYPGPDGRMRTGRETYARKGDAERALVLIEAQMSAGEWIDPERARFRLGDYASAWVAERPGLRPRTADLYRWLLGKHIAPYLGGIPLSGLSTRLIREWRATLLRNGVSVSVAAKAYRLLRAILTTAVEEDGLLPRNPCRIRGAGDGRATGADCCSGLRVGRGDRLSPARQCPRAADGRLPASVRPEWRYAHLPADIR